MNLDDTLSVSEKAALIELIKAFEAVQVAEVKLHQAKSNQARVKQLVTEELFVTDDDGQRTSLLPENGVVRWNGRTYIFHLDIEGDHGHEVHYTSEVINL